MGHALFDHLSSFAYLNLGFTLGILILLALCFFYILDAGWRIQELQRSLDNGISRIHQWQDAETCECHPDIHFHLSSFVLGALLVTIIVVLIRVFV